MSLDAEHLADGEDFEEVRQLAVGGGKVAAGEGKIEFRRLMSIAALDVPQLRVDLEKVGEGLGATVGHHQSWGLGVGAHPQLQGWLMSGAQRHPNLCRTSA